MKANFLNQWNPADGIEDEDEMDNFTEQSF